MEKKVLAQIKSLCAKYPDQVAKALLDQPFWPHDLEPMKPYTRFDDDTYHGHIRVCFSPDADAWVDIHSELDPEEPFSHRFRTFFGGGQSMRVRNALLVLGLAIKLDNHDRPQNRPPR